jgi:hypothetical protein
MLSITQHIKTPFSLSNQKYILYVGTATVLHPSITSVYMAIEMLDFLSIALLFASFTYLITFNLKLAWSRICGAIPTPSIHLHGMVLS